MGTGVVAEMTAAELRQLDAGSRFAPAFAATHIPLLDEVLDLVGDRCQLNLEIKSLDIYGRDASDAVAALIRDRGLYDQVLVSSFNPITLIKLRHLDRRIALGMLYDGEMPAFLRSVWSGPPLSPQAQHPEHGLVNAGFMAWARLIGVAVNVWTVNEVAEAQRLAALGVDTIITDVPDVLLAALREPGERNA